MGHGRTISVIGLGYVGLPVAVAFGERSGVVGFDVDPARVEELRRGVDRNHEVGPADLAAASVCFTSDAEALREAVVTVLGLTFKENVSDLRNTRVVDVVRELEDYGLDIQVHDPRANLEEAYRECGVEIAAADALRPADAVILAVAHDEFVAGGWASITALLRDERGSVIDVKGVLDRASRPSGVDLWRL